MLGIVIFTQFYPSSAGPTYILSLNMVITVPADGPAPNSAGPSAGTVRTPRLNIILIKVSLATMEWRTLDAWVTLHTIILILILIGAQVIYVVNSTFIIGALGCIATVYSSIYGLIWELRLSKVLPVHVSDDFFSLIRGPFTNIV